ncbi:MAG: flavodoxin, partial [Clostridiales Family XIII bacterium]|nr:flavodoxin [Clostridiales Family XIII bacterium]
MNIAVRYFSRGGNTKKVAEAIAKAAGVEARDCSAALTEPLDLLFLGGSIYASSVDQALKDFVEQLDP